MNDTFDVYGYLSNESEQYRIEQRARTPAEFAQARQAVAAALGIGGAGAALAAGHVPEAVIGDFDSITEADKARIPDERLFHIAEQDTTDFEKALSRIAAPLVLAVGFLGARVDHQLAALNVLVRQAAQPCVLIGKHEVIFHLPLSLHLDLARGDVVSLFPMAPVTGRSTGLDWPIDGLHFAPHDRVGTSNRAQGPARIETEGPGLLAILPRERLLQVIDAFITPPGEGGSWPR